MCSVLRAPSVASVQSILAMTSQYHISSATLGSRATRKGPRQGQPIRTPGLGVIYPKQGTSELILQGQIQPTGCYQLQDV